MILIEKMIYNKESKSAETKGLVFIHMIVSKMAFLNHISPYRHV